MGKRIQIFIDEQFGTICTVEQTGTMLFCGPDVATALGYDNPGKAIAFSSVWVSLKESSE